MRIRRSARPQSRLAGTRMVSEKSQGTGRMSANPKKLRGNGASISGVQSASMRITVIEDDDRVARGLVTVLAQAGFEVHRIATAAEAVRAAPSDVVLVDLGLPDGDGLDVIRKLRDRPETAVIAVTARARGARAGPRSARRRRRLHREAVRRPRVAGTDRRRAAAHPGGSRPVPPGRAARPRPDADRRRHPRGHRRRTCP